MNEHGAFHGTDLIEPAREWPLPDFRRVWQYRELIYFLARRDIAVRYRQTAVGAAWAIIQPVGFAAAFSLVLSLWSRPPTSGIPYPVFALAGMSVWLFVSSSLTHIAGSTVGSSALISKVYFPRLVIPLAALIPPAVDFLIAFGVLAVAMAFWGVGPPAQVVFVPLIVLLAAATVFGAGLWLSALAVRHRDVQHVVPFVVQIGLFASPVLYQLNLVPERYQALYALNPMVGVLEGFRWALLGTDSPGAIVLIPVVTAVILLVTGLMYFTRAEASFADDI
jgi:lipopolysaccharide transport system permease protein